MNREQQYNTLVEIVANVRLLLAHGDTNDYAEKIKADTENLAVSLGYSKDKFYNDAIKRYMELNKSLDENNLEGRTHKMQVLVDIFPMANGTTLYIANIDIAGERDFSVEGKSMKSVMVTVRAEAKARSINRDEIEILGEFNKSNMSEEDAKVWATNIFDL
ncbi:MULTISPECIES: hypothetical protein [Bacillus cereus group]|uniref:hypothetical protein n=1 Tax=Bacillus cereus group TaxID=86661 RepID=UPI00065B75B1|nr:MULTISPECIES: hypothetical protein [Bacillus cereus group]KMP65152.1 hypothetical protein TU57_10365 [Bacillus cereus]MDX6046679.1 hypothetical protein [Bacillus paranthracis]